MVPHSYPQLRSPDSTRQICHHLPFPSTLAGEFVPPRPSLLNPATADIRRLVSNEDWEEQEEVATG